MAVAVASLAVLLTLAAAPHSTSAETAAKTAPPPIEMRPMTTYTGYTYLQSSLRSIADNLNHTVSISVTTQAKSTVDELGAIVQLQQWNGSAWVNAGTASTLSAANTSYFSQSTSKAVASGYYYRAKVTHFATEGSTTEQAVEYTDSLLTS
jgi:hypothetical protein